MFNVKKDEFNMDCFDDFIMDAVDEGFPAEIDYDAFIRLCNISQIDEDQFYGTIEDLSSLDILDYDSFCEAFYEEGPDSVGLTDNDLDEKSIYDPITKTYEKI